MSVTTGRITAVEVVRAGATLAGDHLSGSEYLSVSYGWDFEEDGGQLSVGGNVYTYTSATYPTDNDEDPTILTLDGLLATNEDDGTFVAVDPEATDKMAHVDTGNGGGPVFARVHQSLVDKIPEGIRANADQENVHIDDASGWWVVTDVIGQTPVVDGSYIDPDTLPAQPPQEPVAPSSSPTPVLSALGLGALRIAWEPVTNETPVMYDVYLSASTPVEFTSGNLLESTAASFTSTSELPDGTDLVAGTTYYAAIQARSKDQYGPEGSEGSGTVVTVDLSGLDDLQDEIDTLNDTTLPAMQSDIDAILPITETKIEDGAVSTDKLAANSVVAGKIEAGAVTAGKIAADAVTANEIAANAVTADAILAEAITSDKIAANAVTAEKVSAGSIDGEKLTADVILGSNIATALEGERTGLSADRGLYAEGPGGEETLRAQGGNVRVSGQIEATSLSVTGAAVWSGDNVGNPGSSTMMGNKLSGPGNPPTVEAFWDTITLDGGDVAGDDESKRRGLVWYDSHWWVASSVPHSVQGQTAPRLLKFDADGTFVESNDFGVAGGYFGITSLALLSSTFHVGLSDGRTVRASATDGSYQGFLLLAGTNDAMKSGVLGSDGTNLILAWRDSDNNCRWQKYTTAGAKTGSEVDSGIGLGSPTAVVGGSFDFGAARVVVTFNGSDNALVYNGAGTIQVDYLFRAGQIGLAWDGSAFASMESPTTVREHTAALVGFSDLSNAYAASTWYDSDLTGGPHETAKSPSLGQYLKQRARHRLRTSTKVPSGGGSDDPNGARFYIGRTGSRTKLELQGTDTPGSGEWAVLELDSIDLPSGTADATTPPPSSGNFPVATAYRHYSEAASGGTPVTEMRGDGTFWAKTGSAGQAGSATVTFTSTGSVEHTDVTFAVAFASAPAVVIVPQSVTAPQQSSWAVSGITTTGFRINCIRSSGTSNIDFSWHAMAKTQ